MELGLDTAAFSTGARKAQRSTKDLGDGAQAMGRRVGAAGKAIALAGAAVAGAFVLGQLKDLVKQGLEYASSLGETAQQLGVSTKALQEYRYAASQTGIATDEMDAALAKLTRSIGEAEAGSKTQAVAFAKLGISTRDAGGQIKDAGDLLPEIAEKLKALATPAERAALLVDLFGKSGQKLAPLLADGAAGVNGLRDAAQKLGIVLSDAQIQKADETADKIAALQQVLSAKIAGIVVDNTGAILELVNALIKLVEYAGKAARAWRIYVAALGSGKSVQQAALDDLGPGVQLTFDPAEIRRRQSGTFTPGRGPIRTPSAAPVAVPQFLRKPGNARGPLLPRAGFDPFKTKFAANDIDVQAGRNTEALAALVRMAGAAEAAAGRVIPALATLDAATATTREAFEKLGPVAQALFDRLFPAEAASREYELGLAAIRAELDKGTISAERFEEARRRLSIDTLGGDLNTPVGESVFENADAIVPDLDKVSQGLAKFRGLADTTAVGVEIANVRVVKSFADTAQNVLSSLQQLSGAIKGGGFLDILSAVIGLGLQLGGAGAFGKGIQTNLNGPSGGGRIPGFASGTLSAPRGLALVGERGPELVRFAGGERVFKNGDGPGGGGPQRVEIFDTTGLFQFRVDGQIVRNAPAIMDGGARVAASRGVRAQSRRLA